jgi:hypothetical protein
VAPARNGQVMRKSGRTLVVGELAYVYGLTVQSTAGRAVAVPDAAHRARLGIPRRQRLDLRAQDAEVVGVGRQLAAQVFVTDQAAPIDEEAYARPRPSWPLSHHRLQGLPVGVHGHGEVDR